jgi:large subunit ribosomal protein L30
MSKKASKKTEKQSEKTIKIHYYRSSIGYSHKQKQLVQSLGFTKLNQILERPDTPAIRGVVNKVPHLLRIIEE